MRYRISSVVCYATNNVAIEVPSVSVVFVVGNDPHRIIVQTTRAIVGKA